LPRYPTQALIERALDKVSRRSLTGAGGWLWKKEQYKSTDRSRSSRNDLRNQVTRGVDQQPKCRGTNETTKTVGGVQGSENASHSEGAEEVRDHCG
jgi:hypothetical protein